jgi:hypothetical protein
MSPHYPFSAKAYGAEEPLCNIFGRRERFSGGSERLTDEAVRLLDDLRSGKLENQANFILSECFREAASAFSMINLQLKRDGYAASIDPSLHLAC